MWPCDPYAMAGLVSGRQQRARLADPTSQSNRRLRFVPSSTCDALFDAGTGACTCCSSVKADKLLLAC